MDYFQRLGFSSRDFENNAVLPPGSADHKNNPLQHAGYSAQDYTNNAILPPRNYEHNERQNTQQQNHNLIQDAYQEAYLNTPKTQVRGNIVPQQTQAQRIDSNNQDFAYRATLDKYEFYKRQFGPDKIGLYKSAAVNAADCSFTRGDFKTAEPIYTQIVDNELGNYISMGSSVLPQYRQYVARTIQRELTCHQKVGRMDLVNARLQELNQTDSLRSILNMLYPKHQ
jgi:hypothetical protein